jgi:hypothetical protein
MEIRPVYTLAARQRHLGVGTGIADRVDVVVDADDCDRNPVDVDPAGSTWLDVLEREHRGHHVASAMLSLAATRARS